MNENRSIRWTKSEKSTVASTLDTAAIEIYDTVSVATKKRGGTRKVNVEANGPALVVDNITKIAKNTKM